MILWILVVIGIVYFVTESALFQTPRILITARVFGPAAYCASCVGFWVGVSMFFISLDVLMDGSSDNVVLHIFVNGFAGSAVGTLWRTYAGQNMAFQYEVVEAVESQEAGAE